MMKLLCAAIVVLGLGCLTFAGNLNPPAGPVAPTPGPEPRIAINATNTPGDADSIYKISAPGSYYLTGNVTGAAAKHGIEIAASNVTIDLMGFRLVGGAGSRHGITAGSVAGITITNGIVTDWDERGISLSSASPTTRLQNVHSTNNGLTGFSIGAAAVLTECHAANNLASGFSLGSSCVLSRCSAFANTGHGVVSGFACTIVECTATSNSIGGYQVTTGTIVTASSALGNGDYGIHANGGSRIENCTAVNNSGNGILVNSDCTIIGNLCHTNGFSTGDGAGILVTGSGNRIENNHCSDADRGIHVTGISNLIIRNTCAGNTTDWEIASDNIYGPIIDRRGAQTTPVSGFAASSTLGSTDANANYSY